MVSSRGNRIPEVPAPEVPELVRDEILLRLPTKSIIWLRSVCKNWSSLIRSRHFACRHHKRIRNIRNDDDCIVMYQCAPQLLPNGYPRRPPQISLLSPHRRLHSDIHLTLPNFPPRAFFSNIQMICYNGISLFPDPGRIRPIMRIFFWNPDTRHTEVLRDPKIPLSPYVSQDQCWPAVYVGFGFTSTNKVVMITLYSTPLQMQSVVELYTLTSNSWTTMLATAPFPVDLIISGMKQPLGDGSILCWLARRVATDAVELDLKVYLILSFDFQKEEFSTIPLPDEIRHNANQELAITRGDAITCITYEENGDITVWPMRQFGDKNSWINIHTLQPFWTQTVSIFSDANSFLVVREGKLCIYNVLTKAIEELPFHNAVDTVLSCICYKESIAPLNWTQGRQAPDWTSYEI